MTQQLRERINAAVELLMAANRLPAKPEVATAIEAEIADEMTAVLASSLPGRFPMSALPPPLTVGFEERN